jgi:hypothetical protein
VRLGARAGRRAQGSAARSASAQQVSLAARARLLGDEELGRRPSGLAARPAL